MTLLDVLAVFLPLIALGAHVLAPSRLASLPSSAPSLPEPCAAGSAPDPRKRLWALVAAPLLMVSVLAHLTWLRLHPDPLLNVGWGEDALTTGALQALGILTAALVLADLLLLAGHRRLEPKAWWSLVAFALPTLLAFALAGEILRVGQGPRTDAAALALAVSCRLAVALGAGESLAPRPPSGRPFWCLPAGLALLAYPLALPAEIRRMLFSEGDLPPGDLGTLGAAALLFLVARWLPLRLRRPALMAAALLAAVLLARVAYFATTFPVWMEPIPLS